MHEEEAFIKAVRTDTDPDMACLVYADWLEEHSHASRAEFLRLSVDLPKLWATFRATERLDPYVEQIARTQIRLRELRAEMSMEWVARVARGKVSKCALIACPSLWQDLADSANPRVRRCTVCAQEVAFCFNWQELNDHSRGMLLPFA